MTRERPIRFALALLLGTLATPVLSQEQAPAQRDRNALIGLWEGFDSEGGLLDLEVTFGEPEDPERIEIHARSRAEAGATDLSGAYTFRAHDEHTSYLVGGGEREPVVVSWYNDLGIRLSWPDGRQAILTHLRGEASAPTGPTVTTAGFNSTVQAGLLALAGDWRIASPGGMVHLSVLDPAAGRLEWTGPLGPLGTTTEGPVELLLLRASDSAWRFRAGEAELRFESADGSLRVTAGDRTGVTLLRP